MARPGLLARLDRPRWCRNLAGALCAVLLAGLAGRADAFTVRLEEVASGLANPVALAEPPDGSGRLFVAEQIGRVRVIGADGSLREAPFLDVREQVGELFEEFDERGLLGLAFHPEFADNGKFYISYNGAPQTGGNRLSLWQRAMVFAKGLLGRPAPALEYLSGTVYVVERRVSATDPERADPEYERLVLAVDQPQYNHNGGWLDFGPDGHLYLGFGDGGNAADMGEGHAPEGNGQAPGTLLGKVLRIDVDGDEPYAIPDDNPFVGRDGWRGEIWALGFRNPWRCSFDPGGTHELFCGDVGQNEYEEVSIVEKGGNYGWRRKEGRHCFDPEDEQNRPESCPDEDLIDPIIEYPNCTAMDPCLGRSVIGGFVYRGEAIPELRGRYVFGDLVDGQEEGRGVLFAATPPEGGAGAWPFERVDLTNPEAFGYLFAFGADRQGELYVLSSSTIRTDRTEGKVMKIVPAD